MKLPSIISFLFFVLPFRFFVETDWLHVESSIFKVSYTKVDEKFSWDLATVVETEYAKLSQRFGMSIDQAVQIFVCPSLEIFNEMTGHIVPDWGEGAADVSRNTVFIKSPTVSKTTGLAKLIRHELVHLFVGKRMTAPHVVPRWFNEGLACYFAYDEDFADGKAISKALLSDSIVPLDEIDHVLDFQPEKARLAYEESYAVIEFMEKVHGAGVAVDVLRNINRHEDFPAAFRDVTGETWVDFEVRWLRHLQDKYRWRFLMDFETFLWIFMLALFLFVFVAIKFRNRRVIKKWEEEEGFARL